MSRLFLTWNIANIQEKKVKEKFSMLKKIKELTTLRNASESLKMLQPS